MIRGIGQTHQCTDIFSQSEVLQEAQITSYRNNEYCSPVGDANYNPLIDTHVYQVFFNGGFQEYITNIITEQTLLTGIE